MSIDSILRSAGERAPIATRNGMLGGCAHAHQVDIASLPADRQRKMQWLMGRLNLHQVASYDLYAADYFLEKFVAWTGYQIDRREDILDPTDMRSPQQLKAMIDQAQRSVSYRLMEIESLRKMLNTAAGDTAPSQDSEQTS